MEDKNQYGSWRRMRDDELQEQDVWDVLDGEDYEQLDPGIKQASKPSFPSQRFHLSSPRVIPRTTTSSVGIRQNSAPVRVSDWSRIHKREPRKAATANDNHDDDDDDDDGIDHDDDDDDYVSPKEYFTGRIRSPSFSVVEGVGRTLKGRDQSKVRNAVLKRTGFLE